jgi:hypothetical protein
MSEFKGTKGKWEIYIDPVIKGELFIMANKIPIIRIAVNNYISKEEAIFNALLISKALEMLEMLEKMANGEHFVGVQGIRKLIKEATEI